LPHALTLENDRATVRVGPKTVKRNPFRPQGNRILLRCAAAQAVPSARKGGTF
jgi:hypothetical protein